MRELPGKFAEKLPGKSRDFPEARGSLTPSQRLAKFVSNLQIQNRVARRINFHSTDRSVGMLAENLPLQIQILFLEFQEISITDTDLGLKRINSVIILATMGRKNVRQCGYVDLVLHVFAFIMFIPHMVQVKSQEAQKGSILPDAS